MMLGYLLARAGQPVVVLEKHADFFRDFRGDTIHPSTLDVMAELGLLDEFLALPHDEVRELGAQIGGEFLRIADLTRLPTRCKFVAMTPQWDFLNFLAEHGRRLPNFHLEMDTEAHDLIVQPNGRVSGVRAQKSGEALEIEADLVIAADGRSSVLRERAGLEVHDLGAPIDALWFRLSRGAQHPPQRLGRHETGPLLVLIQRTDYWQCAFVIRKGGFDELAERQPRSRSDPTAALIPWGAERVGELATWDDDAGADRKVDRLRRWYQTGCSASATPRTQCRPSAASASTSPSKTPLPQPTSLQPRRPARSRLLYCRPCARRQFPTVATQGAQVFLQRR